MPRSQTAQLNIRSRFARDRAQELSQTTGRTVTEVVEDALRAYVPPGSVTPVGNLVWRGPILVRPATGRRKITVEETNAAIEAARNREE